MFERIQRRLLNGYTVEYDKAVFDRYCKKKITIEECLEQFKENNGIGDDIDLQEFERWLASLGWVQDE